VGTFRVSYKPDPVPANLPMAAQQYLEKELSKLDRIVKTMNDILANHEQRISTLEP